MSLRNGTLVAGVSLLWACSAKEPDKGEAARGAGAEPVAAIGQALGTPLSLVEDQPTLVSPGVPFPYSGRVVAGSVSPTSDLVALVASERGGLWRTANAGSTWSHVDGLVPSVMGSVLHSPSNASIVIATVTYDLHTKNMSGIWRSTDAGVTWKQPPTAVPAGGPTNAYAIAFSPDSNHVYVGTDAGLAVSSDLGATWTYVDPSPSSGGVLAVAAQPGGIVNVMEYCNGGGATCDEAPPDAATGLPICNGFHRSADHGATWPTTGTNPLGGAAALQTIAPSPFEPNVLLAVGIRNPTGGLTCSRFDAFESDDGGVTWTSLNAAVTKGNGRPPFIAAHPSSDGVSGHFDVYYSDNTFTHRQTCSGTGPGLRCSSTWQDVDTGFPGHVDNNAIAWGTGSNCPMYLLGDGGPQTTSDCGLHWQVVGSGPAGFHALQISDLAGTVHPGASDFYLTIQDNGDWASSDSGAHWPNSPFAEGFNIEAVHSLPTPSQTVAFVGCGTCRYLRGNSDWSVVDGWPSPPGNRASSGPVAVANNVWVQFGQALIEPGDVVPPVDTDNTLFLTSDNGGHWTSIATVQETLRNLGDYSVNQIGTGDRGRIGGPAATPTLFQPVLKAANGALGLKRVRNVVGGTPAVEDADSGIVLSRSIFDRPAFAVDPRDAKHLVAVDSATNQIVFSDDTGDTWTQNPLATATAHGSGKFYFNFQEFDGSGNVVGGVTTVTAIAIDNSDSNRVLVGTEANGVFASFDHGASWVSVPGSDQLTSVLGFFFDEGHSDVLISTYSRGLWKIGWCDAAGGADTTAPTFAFVPPDITTANCGTVDIGTARAVDVCNSGAVTITNDRPAKFPPGTTVVTWTARDAAGNAATATQRITLVLGDDPACCPAGTNVILGTTNNDSLTGTSGSDCILGRGAQDTIKGMGGNDYISGGDGDDNIDGGDGDDVIFGGAGQDQLTGGLGNDSLSGDDGDDTVHGNAGNDTLHGGQGQDHLFGDDGADRLFGDDGNDTLEGGTGNDVLAGNAGNADVCTDASGTNVFESCETAPGDSCANGVSDGTESDVDCGGGCATSCADTRLCNSGNDCANGLCANAHCAPSSGIATSVNGLLQATLKITTDFGSGYCAELDVINNARSPTVDWSVNLQIPQATTYTTWNGNFSGSGGAVTVSPNSATLRTLAAGAFNKDIGFCANRVAGTHGLPSVTSATGKYF